jgi:hypothetical protein
VTKGGARRFLRSCPNILAGLAVYRKYVRMMMMDVVAMVTTMTITIVEKEKRRKIKAAVGR